MKYFKISDFASPDLIGSGEKMDKDFLQKLDQAREIAGIPFIVNSGFRTKKHNEKVGGSKESSHMKGCAVDLHASGSREKYLIVTALLKIGFNRIGVGNTFIHVDWDVDKSQNVIWTY